MKQVINYKEGQLYITDNAEEYRELRKTGPVVFVEGAAAAPSGADYIIEDAALSDDSYLYRAFCHMAGVPYMISETDRLIIRESIPSDAAEFKRIYRKEPSGSFMSGSEDLTEEGLSAYIKNMYGFYGFGLFTILLKSTGQIIGRVGFSFEDDAKSPELGFIIEKEMRGKGFAYEAAAAVIKYMRDELEIDELSARVSESNDASLKLLNKLKDEYGIKMIITKDEGLR